MRARDVGLACGSLPVGERNRITDVAGVVVGHATLIEGDIRTGVTAILPHDGDLFRDKVVAAAYVLNGFGKSTGLVQLNELGALETPILLTNTFSVSACANGLIRRAIVSNPGIGRETSTVNPVVFTASLREPKASEACWVTIGHVQYAVDEDTGRDDVIGIDRAKLAQVLCLHDGQFCRHRDHRIEVAA